MQVKTRLAAALAVTFVVGTASWATVGLTGPARADTGTNGGTWGLAQPVPGLTASTTPPTSGNGAIKAITCTTPGDCVAVGDQVSVSGGVTTTVPVVVTESGGTWSSPQSIDGTAGLGSGTSAGLTEISCSDAGDCTATGSYNGTDGHGHAFYTTETPTTGWSTATAVSEAGQPSGTNSVITSVSCAPSAPGYCAIVAYYANSTTTTVNGATTTSTTIVPFTLDEAQGTWEATPRLVTGLDSLPETGNAELTSVSCAAQGQCTAGGGIAGQPFVVSESSGAWGNARAVTSVSTGAIMAISCPDASDCTAAGFYDDSSKLAQAFTVDEQGGSWGPATLLASSSLVDASSGLMLGCSSVGNCVVADRAAIRMDNSAYLGVVADIETSSGGWGPLSPVAGFPDVWNGPGIELPQSSPTGLSCAPGGDCTIVGYYLTDKDPDPVQGFAATTSDGVVGSEQPVLPGTNSEPQDTALSCPKTGFCTLGYSMSGAPQLLTEATGATIAVKASTPRVTYGSAAETLTATVTGADGGTPTGTVAVTDAGTPVCTITLADGDTCSPSATAIPVGTDTLTATYSGDPTYIPAASTATVTVDPPSTAAYTPLAPVRVLDTRDGTGGFTSPVGAGQDIALQVTGQNGVPATGVTAVVLNLTATGPTASSYVTAYPDGQPRPTQGSNLNFTKGETIPNLVTVPVGSDGKIDLYNNAGTVNLVADLQGYYATSGGSGLTATAGPIRLLDTRNGTGGFTSPVGAGKSIALQVTGQDNIPATGVTAVVLNLTATGPTASGWVIAYPDGTTRPAEGSNLNFTKGETIPNLVTVPVGSDGKIDLYNSAGSVNLVGDLFGYYTATGGSALTTDGPVRVLDTRNGTGGFSSPVGAGKSIALQITGQNGLPATGVTAVVLNLTATGPTASGWVMAYPDGISRPAYGSNLNFTKGETIPNLVIVPVGSDGKIDLYNSAGSVNLVADLFGYFTG